MASIKKVVFALLLALCLAFAFAAVGSGGVVSAEMDNSAQNGEYTQGNGLFGGGLAVNLTLAIYGGEWQVMADVKNEFTLFPSTISVYVELYSSIEYPQSFADMTLEATGYVNDLDIWQTVKISASSGGQKKYWQARMRYKQDGRGWISKNTPTFLCDADGTFIE